MGVAREIYGGVFCWWCKGGFWYCGSMILVLFAIWVYFWGLLVDRFYYLSFVFLF